MKLSTRKILGLDAAVLVLMAVLVVLPIPGVWREYLQILVLTAVIVGGVVLLGWAKPRGRDIKVATMVVILAAVVFQAVMFVFLGIRLGFWENTYRWSLESIGKVFLPMILIIVGEEIFRGQMIEKGKGSVAAVIVTMVALVGVEISFQASMYNWSEAQAWFDFIVVLVGPTILKNIFLTYVAYQFDYRINIGYRLVMEMPIYLLPVWPNVSRYLAVIFELLLVTLLLGGMISLRRRSGEMKLPVKEGKRRRQKSDEDIKTWMIVRRVGFGILGAGLVIMVALMSGIFKYYFLSVGSNSMKPVLGRGDMVLVKKTNKCEEMKEGEVLVYSHDEATIVHRITEVNEDAGECWFKTKGDANANEDSWIVEQNKVIGVAKGRIVALGYPTLWLNELFNGGK